jgi:lipoate-protein ligase A
MSIHYPKASWRLVITEPSSGAWNMALDEALLESVSNYHVLPTLRLFYWNPPCLSLGHAQTYKSLDLDSIKSRGWDLVRRPTGGKAILHTDEITYSVIAPIDEPRVKGSILESYQSISNVLIHALKFLGIQANADSIYSNDQPSSHQPVCFETPSNYEITVEGKKILGSAQMRKHQSVLQHGSLPISGDLTRINKAFSWESVSSRIEANQRLLSHATTLEQILGKVVLCAVIQKVLISSFEKCWNISFRLQNPSDQEIARARILIEEKYGNSNWTFRV